MHVLVNRQHAPSLEVMHFQHLVVHGVQEFPWIATEKDFFGKPGSDYDFEAQDVQAAFEEYEAANQSLQRLANKVNRKVPLHQPASTTSTSCGHNNSLC